MVRETHIERFHPGVKPEGRLLGDMPRVCGYLGFGSINSNSMISKERAICGASS
jgi:hypothetical protein